MPSKSCNRCKRELDFNFFHRKKGTHDGLNSRCKKCIKEVRKIKALNSKKKMIPSKICNKCNTKKKISLFSINKQTSDGYSNSCKKCLSEYRKEVYRKNKKKKDAGSDENKVLLEQGLKRCNECREIFGLISFYKSKTTKDGREGKCKECRKNQRRKSNIKVESKKCTSCKKILPSKEFNSDSSRNDNLDAKCKKCRKKYYSSYYSVNSNYPKFMEKSRKSTAEWRKRNPNHFSEYYRKNKDMIDERIKKYKKTDRGRFVNFKIQADQRNIKRNIKEEEFIKITKSPCFYCGEDKDVGIDRKDSSKGYVSDNCVPCCSICNYGKNTLLPDEFISHIKKIVSYQESGILEGRAPKVDYTGIPKEDHYLSPFGKFTGYRNSAKNRGIPFNLEYSDFVNLWQKPCNYCGSTIDTIGLDRIDNSIGYKLNNITPCCTNCNNLKRQMSVEDFLNHCEKVIKHCKK